MDNSESNLSHKANETTYYTNSSAAHKRMTEKYENGERIRKLKWPFWLGLAISFIQPPLYLLSKSIICNEKQEYECAYPVFGVLVMTVFLFTFGILFAIYSWRNYTKNRHMITRKNIVILAAKCFLGAIFMLILYVVAINLF